MSWLLDTNVISELVKPRPNAGVTGWLTGHAGDEPRLFISALTLAEIYRGALRLDRNSSLYARLQTWLTSDIAIRFAHRILPFDEHVAHTWGKMTAALPKGIAVSNMDSLIAATAQHHGLILLTRNISDMRHFVELVVENPWR
ncbi:MAG: type II toxin-antitoxin system VapC family toxin [Geminicoccaceae bacterium]